MKRILEAVAKEVNFGSEVMVQLTITDGSNDVYVVIHDGGGEFKVWSVSEDNILDRYVNDSANDFNPSYSEMYEDSSDALASEYVQFFEYAQTILDGFSVTTEA